MSTRIGISLSSEEHGPSELVAYAQLAEHHGFADLVLSDHFHPWVHSQGNSPFVWSVIGAIASTTSLRVGTAVTCPTFRTHPAVIAQAAATSQLLLKGRFFLGVGSGENLNEHILGDRWPPADTRLAMLDEAITIMRGMWRGDSYDHRGTFYEVDNARIYSLPADPPPIYVSGFGPSSRALAARAGDGYINTAPDPDALRHYRAEGGKGPGIATLKCCVADTEDEARKLVHKLWPNLGLPGELAQELATPEHFEQACELVDVETASASLPCGPDPEVHVASIQQAIDAGYSEIYVHQIGPEQEGFLHLYRHEVLPRLGL